MTRPALWQEHMTQNKVTISNAVLGATNPPKSAHFHGGSWPSSNTRFLEPTESTRQMPTRSSHPSFHDSCFTGPILRYGLALSPLHIAPSPGGSRPPSNTSLLGSTQVHTPAGISIGSAVFAGLTNVTYRHRHIDRGVTIRQISNTHARLWHKICRSKVTASQRCKQNSFFVVRAVAGNC